MSSFLCITYKLTKSGIIIYYYKEYNIIIKEEIKMKQRIILTSMDEKIEGWGISTIIKRDADGDIIHMIMHKGVLVASVMPFVHYRIPEDRPDHVDMMFCPITVTYSTEEEAKSEYHKLIKFLAEQDIDSKYFANPIADEHLNGDNGKVSFEIEEAFNAYTDFRDTFEDIIRKSVLYKNKLIASNNNEESIIRYIEE